MIEIDKTALEKAKTNGRFIARVHAADVSRSDLELVDKIVEDCIRLYVAVAPTPAGEVRELVTIARQQTVAYRSLAMNPHYLPTREQIEAAASRIEELAAALSALQPDAPTDPTGALLKRAVWDAIEARIDSAPVDGVNAEGDYNERIMWGQGCFVDGLRAARLAALAAIKEAGK